MRCFFILVGVLLMCTNAQSDQNIKQPNVAGQFYPKNALQLATAIDKMIKNAKVTPSTRDIDIIIVPHAGYVYSGQVAAYSFKAVSNKQFNTIIILAPSHFYGFKGISIWEEGGFNTPLGTVPVDAEFAKQLIARNDKFYFDEKAFEQEHSLEVEIPFLQKTFDNFKIVPIVMGQTSFSLLDDFATALHSVIADRDDVLIVVSTDLSHYHDDKTATAMDHRTIETIASFNAEKLYKECQRGTMEACGCVPTTAAILYAKHKGINESKVLGYAHSGQVSGDLERVVGYSSIVFFGKKKINLRVQDEGDLSLEQKKELIKIAKETVIKYVDEKEVLEIKIDDPRLKEIEGAFVTIHKKGKLRGCIGNIIGRQPLSLTVRDMAVAAASADHRFTPVTHEELKDIDIEVSVLSKPWVVKSADEIELGKHGVIISRGGKSGVFLPQVATDTGWSKEEFLGQLCSQKAGLPWDCWKDPATKVEVFTANVFGEHDVQ